MSTAGEKLRDIREKAGLTLRKAAMKADIDVAVLSKVERGERKLTKELILRLSELYNVKPEKLIIGFLSEKILYEIRDEEFGLEALKVAEKELKYKKKDVEKR